MIIMIRAELKARITGLKKSVFPGRLLPLPKQIKRHDGYTSVEYKGKELKFIDYEHLDFIGWIEEQFVGEQYKDLDVAGKNVIDVGAAMGDTPIYFVCNGAKKVYAWEIDRKRSEVADKNIKLNHMSNKITLFNAGFKNSFLDKSVKGKGWVMKIDCDGCEYGMIKSATPKQLQKLEQIIIEYTYGYEPMVKKLRNSGFEVSYTEPVRQQGIIYAKRLAE